MKFSGSWLPWFPTATIPTPVPILNTSPELGSAVINISTNKQTKRNWRLVNMYVGVFTMSALLALKTAFSLKPAVVLPCAGSLFCFFFLSTADKREVKAKTVLDSCIASRSMLVFLDGCTLTIFIYSLANLFCYCRSTHLHSSTYMFG